MRRVLVVGTTNSGKTTMARRLARRLGVPHVELDALFWEPNWAEAADDVFLARVTEATVGEGWVVCGNYQRAMDVLWPQADTVVWLDPPLRVVLRRAVLRTLWRGIRRKEVWPGTGNREKVSTLWSHDSLYRWAKQTHGQRKARYEAAMADPHWAHLSWVRLRSPSEARRWLRRQDFLR